ncbi:MAG: hypothetical protein M0009_16145 [Deltaproteobacteria bacterium]|nr:hypothetical protein [Deltaproteobacteria bacterium]
MKLSEVPQDDIQTFHGEKKALFAVDDQGHYVQTTTQGWDAEETVLREVIDDFEEKAKAAALRVRQQETSPIEYFMFKRWMDPLTLAQAMGFYRWQVKRHFKPAVFRKLKDETLREYARIFRISAEELRHFPGEDDC